MQCTNLARDYFLFLSIRSPLAGAEEDGRSEEEDKMVPLTSRIRNLFHLLSPTLWKGQKRRYEGSCVVKLLGMV